jgi:hypothetical protein
VTLSITIRNCDTQNVNKNCDIQHKNIQCCVLLCRYAEIPMPNARFSIVMLGVFKQSVVILNVVALFYFLNEFSSLCFKITESLKAFVKMLDQAGKKSCREQTL